MCQHAFSQDVHGTANSRGAAVQDMSVDHGGLDVAVAEEFLDGADIVAVFEQVGGKGMAERVAASALRESGFKHSLVDCFLEKGFVEMIPTMPPCFAVDPAPVLGEYPLP